ncbi:MAG: AraC family transcriptional regulator [Nocardioidaceae bacterium]|jgi:AraC-like DNA-binding protein|nr:AraC family transcriptional regulator [Nocardioidaceae bacterium]
MLTFDTADLERRDRAHAIVSVMREAALASHVVHEDPESDVYLRMSQWQFGSMTLVKMAISGVTVTRTRRQTARDDESLISIGVMGARAGRQIQDDEATALGPTTVYGMEVTRPYQHVSTGPTRALTVLVRADDLGLPLERVAQARSRLNTTPVTSLFLQHVRALVDQADQLVDVPTAGLIEPATLQLTRALLASAMDDPLVREALADTLLLRVRAYIRSNLQDRKLNAATIAAAHHVSQRHLYKVCAAGGMRLESWIIFQRLEAARVDLAKASSRGRTIAAVAAKWGFSNPSHFAHRFREAYGLPPREWQQLGDHLDRSGAEHVDRVCAH